MIASTNLSRQHAPLKRELDAAIGRVLARDWYILGAEVEAFEHAFAAYCGTSHCIAVANGTDALQLALRALAIGPGAKVATVANAGGYATTAIRLAGAIPCYVDVDPQTLLIDPMALEAGLAADVRAIVITHLYGRMADVDAIARIARPRGIALVEDCAQAHGAHRRRPQGGNLQRCRLLQLLSHQESRRAGRCGCLGDCRRQDCAAPAAIADLRVVDKVSLRDRRGDEFAHG